MTTNQGSPFDNRGRVQIRDFLIGSSNASAPTLLALGSGTAGWNAAIGSLQFPTRIFSASRAAEGSQVGSFYVTISSANYPLGSVSEVAISGANAMFARDVFTAQPMGNAGSEMRIVSIFRVGS